MRNLALPAAAAAHFLLSGMIAHAEVDQATIDAISTPNEVETSIGTLKFIDGAPLPETAKMTYDYLDRMRGVDAFLKGIPAASLHMLIEGPRTLGAEEAHQVVIMDELLQPASLFLTANSSTMYFFPILDLERDGPTVVEAPSDVIGAFNDAYFRYIGDVGRAGPDKGKGGMYLILPPGYEGEEPEGYFILRSPSYRVWTFMRGNIANGLEAAAKHIKGSLRVYPLSKAENPPEMEFISGSGVSFNTVHANDFQFYEELNAVVQKEPIDFLDPETRGLFASIGIEKGKPFEPDDRMRAILEDAVAIGNAAARSILWYPREDMNLDGVRIYPDRGWLTAFINKNVFFDGPDGFTMNTDARVTFHYPFTAVTPAMANPKPGSGSDYGIAFLDADEQPFDGSKTYKMTLPKDVPVNNFWSVTLYDSQTRSMLQTDQPLPALDSIQGKPNMNEDGSIDLYFAPEAPEGQEANWVQSIPGKSWFTIFRVYGPLEPWFEQTWKPSDISVVE
ncbi:MAG: DUF1254 domain-containing protein [Pseudomonadota bacterium]